MKKLLTIAVTSSFVALYAGSAFACGFSKSVEKSGVTNTASSSHIIKTDEAMSTFDPKVLDTTGPGDEIKPVIADTE